MIGVKNVDKDLEKYNSTAWRTSSKTQGVIDNIKKATTDEERTKAYFDGINKLDDNDKLKSILVKTIGKKGSHILEQGTLKIPTWEEIDRLRESNKLQREKNEVMRERHKLKKQAAYEKNHILREKNRLIEENTKLVLQNQAAILPTSMVRLIKGKISKDGLELQAKEIKDQTRPNMIEYKNKNLLTGSPIHNKTLKPKESMTNSDDKPEEAESEVSKKKK